MEQTEFIDQNRIALNDYSDRFDNKSLRHILLNYSDTEVGKRHPELPLGIVFRDQGQFDLYAGSTRLIGDIDGSIYMAGKNLNLDIKSIHISCDGPGSFVLNGKKFSDKAHSGTPFLAAKNLEKLDGIAFVKTKQNETGESKSTPNGDIINTLTVGEVFELLGVFEDEDLQDTPEIDSFNDFQERIK